MILSCIAVDDEPLALNMIKSYINQTPSLSLKGTFSNAIDALKALHENPVDVIFLDIRMHDLSGIELAKVLDQYRAQGNMRIIFTTAYDQYALESYKVDALDYLLKPFNYTDFYNTVAKALRYYQLIKKPEPTEYKDTESLTPKEPLYIYLKVEYQLVRVAIDDILYIESDKDYIKMYLINENKPLLSLTSMKAIEEKLPKDRFMRIHRSFIVSLDRIKAATKGTVEINGKNIPVTDQYKETFAQFLETWK